MEISWVSGTLLDLNSLHYQSFSVFGNVPVWRQSLFQVWKTNWMHSSFPSTSSSDGQSSKRKADECKSSHLETVGVEMNAWFEWWQCDEGDQTDLGSWVLLCSVTEDQLLFKGSRCLFVTFVIGGKNMLRFKLSQQGKRFQQSNI